MTSEERIKEVLAPLVAEMKSKMFTPESQHRISDADCLGVICSKFLSWDIDHVIECAKSAFEDCNFHDGVQMLDKMEEDYKAVSEVYNNIRLAENIINDKNKNQ